MNRFFTLLFAASCLTAVGQVTYPYNPDGNADGGIAVGDLQDFLTVYGNDFEPSEIVVDGQSLSEVILQLQNQIASLENVIDGLSQQVAQPVGVTFGERIVVDEFTELGTVVWGEEEVYGHFKFEQDGILTGTLGEGGLFFYGAYLLPDSLDFNELSLEEIGGYEVGYTGLDLLMTPVTIPMRSSEQVVFVGLNPELTGAEPSPLKLNFYPLVPSSLEPLSPSSVDPTNFFSESFNADSLNVVYAHELEVVGEYLDDPIVAVPAGVDIVLCASGKAYIDLSLSDVTRLTFESYNSSIWQSANIVECPSNQKRLATVVKIQGEWLELK